MTLMRFLLPVSANLLVTIIGGIILGFGANAAIGSATMLGVMGQFAHHGAIGLPEQATLSLTNVVTAFLFPVGMLTVGVGCLVIGLRGLIKRIEAGIPDEDEGDPKTETGRIGQVILYGIGAAIGLWGLFMGSLDNLSYLVLWATDAGAIAEIETIRSQSRTRGDDPSGVYFDYRFTTHSGEIITGSKLVPSSAFSRKYKDGGQISVLYSVLDPQSHEFPDIRNWSGIAWFMAFRLLLAVMGVWGLRRAVRIGRIENHQADPMAT